VPAGETAQLEATNPIKHRKTKNTETGSIRSTRVGFRGPVTLLFIWLSFRELPDSEQLTLLSLSGGNRTVPLAQSGSPQLFFLFCFL
jgi:hypothetical protein